LSDSPCPRASIATTRRPAATMASTMPGSTQLVLLFAMNPWCSTTSGPSPQLE
jgi:hypothetical protein